MVGIYSAAKFCYCFCSELHDIAWVIKAVRQLWIKNQTKVCQMILLACRLCRGCFGSIKTISILNLLCHFSISEPWKTLAGLTGLGKVAGRGDQEQIRQKAGGHRTRGEDRTSDQREVSRAKGTRVDLTGPVPRGELWDPSVTPLVDSEVAAAPHRKMTFVGPQDLRTSVEVEKITGESVHSNTGGGVRGERVQRRTRSKNGKRALMEVLINQVRI